MSTLNSKERLVQEVIAELRNLDGELDLMDQAIADRLGVNRTDAQCMDIITRSGPISAGDLAERVGLTAGAITTVLDRLERRQWIRRQHDTVDRRRVMVCPNQSQRHTIHPVFSGLVGNTRKLLERYSTDDLAVIGDFLRRVAAVAAEHRNYLRIQLPAKSVPTNIVTRRAGPDAASGGGLDDDRLLLRGGGRRFE